MDLRTQAQMMKAIAAFVQDPTNKAYKLIAKNYIHRVRFRDDENPLR